MGLPSAALLLPWLALCQSADCGALVSFQPSCLLLWTVLKAHCWASGLQNYFPTPMHVCNKCDMTVAAL